MLTDSFGSLPSFARPFANALGYYVGWHPPCLGQHKCKLIPAETRRSI